MEPESLEVELQKQLNEVLDAKSVRQALPRVLAVMNSRIKMHSGPLPSAKTFADYESTLPGCAERIVKMAENSLAHRASFQTELLRKEHFAEIFGKTHGFIALLVSIGCAAVFAFQGNNAAAVIFLAAPVLTAIVALITSKGAVRGSNGR